MKLLRHTDEWVGLIVVLSIALFGAAALHAGLLSDWFRPTANLRVLLPATGSGGLAAGADVQLLGARVGSVRRIVLAVDQPMYAEAELEVSAESYIRRDSVAVIKKSFGVAGAAFLELSRGSGDRLDWQFAVVNASTERAPTDDINALIDDLKKKIFPVLDDAGRGMKALADTVEGITQGQGSVGHLLKNDEAAIALNKTLTNLVAITEQLNGELTDLRALTASVSRPNGVPGLLRRTDAALASVQSAARDLANATPQVPGISRSLSTGASTLPALLTQTQQLVADMSKLSAQLRNTWPLSNSVVAEPRRLPSRDVKP